MNRDRLPRFTGPNRTGELQFNYMDRLVRRDLRVARVEDITPRYRRVVLAGDDLADGFPIAPFSPDHVRVFFPNPETGELVAPREQPDGRWVNEGGTGEAIHRDYTVRAWDPEARELSLDFVLHGHGFASRWASQATPGDPIVVNGPSSNWRLPQNYPRYLALGDETALPAIARIIAEAPAEAHVTALIEIPDASEEQKLTGPAELDLRWIHRDSAPVAEGHLSALETALRAWRPPADPGTLFAFAAGETESVKPIRRHLRTEVGLTKDQVVVDGYWRRGVGGFDHHDADIDDN
ncbi:siderophore-interacting protein [Actinocorallia sp. API 0066]|uniref:siderophore-interacting protein n=1 Tax=Actinocorallia sp. API 0066 TaxID=2896846 RepID=UPI001E6312F0|nr:siderophore-interacting protein [Actinocorallia sp. API 0066]MCD0449092.1 siderophore-interacting protein [Actinocorallia sp. API 0066]